MKKWLIVASLLILLGMTGFWGFRMAMENAWIKINDYDIRTEGILQVGDLAPDLELMRADGDGASHLSDYFRDKPLVLIFGSYT